MTEHNEQRLAESSTGWRLMEEIRKAREDYLRQLGDDIAHLEAKGWSAREVLQWVKEYLGASE